MKWLRLPVLLALIAVTIAACGGSGTEVTTNAGGSPPEFVVLAGDDGLARFVDGRLEPIEGLESAPYATGPWAVPAFSGSAAVLGDGSVALVTATGADVVECEECAGIASTGDEIVTTRRNYQPGEGFDIVTFDEDLEPFVVPAERLEEQSTIGYPAENSGSPVTLVATDERITVSYLSLNGGARAGPEIIAQYSPEGDLLDTISVPGLVGDAAVSPDGRYVAMELGGSGGACRYLSDLAVILLDPLELVDSGSTVPSEYTGVGDLSDPWFTLTDLVWDEGVVRATGGVHVAGDDGCDADPDEWVHTFDPESGISTDVEVPDLTAERSIDGGCEPAVRVTGGWTGQEAVAIVDGASSPLGRYGRLGLGAARPEAC